MRVVLDTNVLVAAFTTEGVCATLLRRARKREFQLVLCPIIFQEFRGVLRKKFAATTDEVRDAVTLIHEAVEEVVPDPAAISRISRDRSDDAVLACALAASAEVLVTGDDDLLSLRAFHGIQIIQPRDFEALFAD